MVMKMARLSATVPKYIVEEVDKIALKDNMSRSQLISKCLKSLIQTKEKILLAEGYRAMAEKHDEFVLLTQDAAKEVLPNW